MNTSKLTNLMFRQIDNVVYDLMSGATAIKTSSGLISFDTKSGELQNNPLETLGFELPAFAILTPLEQVTTGDLIVVDGKAVGFVTIAVDKQLEVVRIDGFTGEYKPTAIKMFGQPAGIQVVKSLFNTDSTNDGNLMGNPLMLMALMGDNKRGDMSSMLPFLLLGNGANTSGINPLMLMALMGDKSPFR